MPPYHSLHHPLLKLTSQVSPLLSSAAALVRKFPKYFADVVVSVARKTDAQVGFA